MTDDDWMDLVQEESRVEDEEHLFWSLVAAGALVFYIAAFVLLFMFLMVA